MGAASVVRCNPDTGIIDERVSIPVSRVTSCCIGGENMDILFVTTAKDPERSEPLAGTVFQLGLPRSLGLPVEPARDACSS